jgi:signal transduction histidine kinase
MKSSLSKKITMSMAALAVGGILLTLVFSNLALNWNFNRYLEQAQEEQNRRILETLAGLYAEATSWIAVHRSTIYVGSTTGTHIRVLDANGALIADSLHGMTKMNQQSRRRQLAQQPRGRSYEYPLYVQDLLVGSVEITHLGQEGLLSGEAAVFRRTVRQTALLTGLGLILLALPAGSLLARRLTGRFAGLSAAAEKWAQGRFTTRAEVDGDDELAVLAETMNKMAARLDEQSMLRKKLAGNISHELRTPLTTVQSYLEAFLDGVIQPDEKNIRAILDESHRLGRLVNELQALNETVLRERSFNLVKLEINTYVRQETQRINPLLQQKDIELTIETDVSPLTVLADEKLLVQILGNLLINAYKYTPQGGQVTVSVFEEADCAGVAVADTGIGIDQEHRPYIFERFYRADPSRTRATGGSGVGLAIVREAAEAMGGYVTVESEPGKGSIFRIYLQKA